MARSWAILERSRETSGLPLVFLLKTLIPVFALLLALQGVAQAIRAAAASLARKRRVMPLAELLAILMVVAVCGLLFAGYPVALTLGGVSLAFRAARPRVRRDELRPPRRAAAAHLRRDDQRRCCSRSRCSSSWA